MTEAVNRKIPWPRILAESFMIVFSILLAFGIERWWDQRLEEAHRFELLEDLRSDFTQTRALLTERVAVAEPVLARTIGFGEWSVQDLDLPRDSIQKLASGMFSGITFTPSLAHYRAASTSGEIALVESDSLLVFLNRFDHAYRGVEQHEALGGEIFYLGPINDLRNEFGGLNGFMTLPDFVADRSNPAVRAAVEASAALQRSTLEGMQGMDEATEMILAELDRLLAGR